MAARKTRRRQPPARPDTLTTYPDPGLAGEPLVVTSAAPGQDYAPAALGELAGQTGFAWHCGLSVPHDPAWRGLAEVHQIDGTDRAQAEAHMRAHGLRSPAAYRLPGPWTPPRPKAWAPKPADPGQPVTWHVYEPARWSRPAYMDGDVYHGPGGEWIESKSYTRAGTIWSAGPASASTSWWAVPTDDPAEPVVIRLRGKASYEGKAGELYQDDAWGQGWRDQLRRAENVRRRGIYPVVHETYESGGYWAHERTEVAIVRWHADPECPLAAGKERAEGREAELARTGADPVWEAVDILTGRTPYGTTPPFCKRCVMLLPEDQEARVLEDSSEIGTPASAGNS